MALRRLTQIGLGHRHFLVLSTSRNFRTTSTTHPTPIFDEDDKILQKVMKERSEDLPTALANPYEKPQRKCILCEHNIPVNYKNVKLLYQYVSPYTGLIYGRHVTGLCKAQHDIVRKAIEQARTFGYMSTYLKEAEFLKDPKLCDPERPVRPHPY